MGQESQIEKKAKAYARQHGFWVRKFKSPGNRAAPDSIFMSPKGVVFFIEFKAPGKKPTAAQLRELLLISKQGGNSYWVDSFENAKEIVSFYLK